MKKSYRLLIFFALALTQTLTLFSQPHKYIPFPDSNAIWVVKQLNEFGQEISGKNYFYPNKDTTISGKSYHIITSCLDSNFTPCEKPEVYLKSWYGLRNDTAARKVFMYDRSAGLEYLLYDFSLKDGDTIASNCWQYGGRIIDNIDTLQLHGKDHLIFYINGGYAPYIEGVGSVAGLFEKAYFFEGGYELVCLMTGEDRTPYFTYSSNTCGLYHWTGVDDALPSPGDEVTVFPNPVDRSSRLELRSVNDMILQVSVYKLTGQALFESQDVPFNSLSLGDIITDPGIYFYKIITRRGNLYSGKIIK